MDVVIVESHTVILLKASHAIKISWYIYKKY